MSSKAMVGFIGLGNMGAHMARNLMKKGHKLVIYDINTKIVNDMVKLGAKAAESPAKLAEESQTIITMLPSHPHVTEVFTNSKTGILNAVQKSTLCLDCSTIDINASKRIAEMCDSKSVTFNDTPVSGGIKAAEQSTLTFMVGAKSKEEFEKAKKYLECMGKNIVHAGNIGSGLAAKICNNMLLGISMIGVSETMNLGIKLGLDKKVLAGIINSSSGRCWSSELYNPVPGVIDGIPPSNQYQGGFATGLMTKDLSLAQNASVDTSTITPMGSMAYNIYKQLCNQGLSNKDFAIIYDFINANKQ